MKRPRSSSSRASNESRSGLTGVRILAISLGLFLAALLLCFFGKLGLDRAELSKSWPSAPAGNIHVSRHSNLFSGKSAQATEGLVIKDPPPQATQTTRSIVQISPRGVVQFFESWRT